MNWSQLNTIMYSGNRGNGNGSVLFICTALLIVILCVESSRACNEAVCASIVSKCMLTQSCKCDLKNCTCCKECSICLSDFYSECCSCVAKSEVKCCQYPVQKHLMCIKFQESISSASCSIRRIRKVMMLHRCEMCPKPNDTNYHMLSVNSHVEDLNDSSSVEGLFSALTEEPDPENRWITYTYPIDFSTIFPPKQGDFILQAIDKNTDMPNCTVAYMTQCMGWNKCKQNCLSMGASSYRWFHDGCCECVGKYCINYGIKESRCPNCNNIDDGDDLGDEIDYGEFDYESQSLGDM